MRLSRYKRRKAGYSTMVGEDQLGGSFGPYGSTYDREDAVTGDPIPGGRRVYVDGLPMISGSRDTDEGDRTVPIIFNYDASLGVQTVAAGYWDDSDARI